MAYRYIGNKTRLLEELLAEVESVVQPGAVVADLMCGTATVAQGLRRCGYKVVASDLMTFAAQHAKVRLTLAGPPKFAAFGDKGYEGVLKELNATRPVKGFFFKEYGPDGDPVAGCPPRKYFTSENAAKLDAIRGKLDRWHKSGRLSSRESVLLRHDLVLAANSVANIAGTYGHFRSTWSNGALRPIRLEPTSFIRGNARGHVVYQGKAEAVAQVVTADLCYLDPPYMKRQYAANYHLIETLARGDEPTPIGVSGLRDWWDQYSDFCSKRRIRDAFTMVIGRMTCPEFLISYSEDGLLAKEELVEFFRTFGRVSVGELRHKRFRSNGSPLGADVKEYLFRVTKF